MEIEGLFHTPVNSIPFPFNSIQLKPISNNINLAWKFKAISFSRNLFQLIHLQKGKGIGKGPNMKRGFNSIVVADAKGGYRKRSSGLDDCDKFNGK